MNIKRNEVLSIFVCLIFVVGCFSSSASVILSPQSTNTHVFRNIFGHCDDLHIKYNKVIIDESVEIDEHDGAVYYQYEIEDGYVLSIWGFFPPGSSLEITVKSEESGVLFPVIYQWTIGGVPASPDVPVAYPKKPYYWDGYAVHITKVNKPIENVTVYITRTSNIQGGISGISVILSKSPDGGTIISFVGKVENTNKRASISYIIDPPGVIIDETLQLDYNVEFKGVLGVKVTVMNVGDTVENLNWSVDMSGLVFLGGHSEGVIDSFPTNATEEIGPKFVFGFGHSIITAWIGDMSINASCFVLGPFVLGIKQPP